MTNYIIIDMEKGNIVRAFMDEDEAKAKLYSIRKHKYIDEHPHRPIWEYDTLKIDNGYNLFKATLVG